MSKAYFQARLSASGPLPELPVGLGKLTDYPVAPPEMRWVWRGVETALSVEPGDALSKRGFSLPV